MRISDWSSDVCSYDLVLDIIDAGPFSGYSPERLDREGGSGAIERVGGTPRVLPDAPLRLDAISRFDANVKYKVRRVRAGSFPISNFAPHLWTERSLPQLSPSPFAMAGGFFPHAIRILTWAPTRANHHDPHMRHPPLGHHFRTVGGGAA